MNILLVLERYEYYLWLLFFLYYNFFLYLWQFKFLYSIISSFLELQSIQKMLILFIVHPNFLYIQFIAFLVQVSHIHKNFTILKMVKILKYFYSTGIWFLIEEKIDASSIGFFIGKFVSWKRELNFQKFLDGYKVMKNFGTARLTNGDFLWDSRNQNKK